MIGAANAAFLGIEMYNVDHWFDTDITVGGGAVQAAYDASVRDSYRIYAVFDSPGSVIGAFGSPARPMYMQSGSGTFFNRIDVTKSGTVHYDVAQGAGFGGAGGSKAFDTFATIGGFPGAADSTQFSPPGAGSDNGGVGNHFQVNWSSNEGVGGTYAWFVAGFPAQANATQNPNGLFSPSSPYVQDGRYYVLLFQATIGEGESLEGNIGVNVVGEGNINDERNFFTNVVPAPGAVALLGLAGLAGTRRRRNG
jgi:hypothetical protein